MDKNHKVKSDIFFFKFHPILDFPINHFMLHNLAVWPGALMNCLTLPPFKLQHAMKYKFMCFSMQENRKDNVVS